MCASVLPLSLAGKSVVLTAAANEIGQGCARYLAHHGASVVAIDRDTVGLDALCDGIRTSGGTARFFHADPTDPVELSAAASAAFQKGVVDVLVTCPMDIEVASIEHSSLHSWRRVIENNLLGPVVAVKTFLPYLKRAANAAIVHLGSIDGLLGNPQVPSYSASKGGIVALTHVMAEEFGPLGIRVNCVARAMAMERDSPIPSAFLPLMVHTPLGRPGYFDEIGAAVRFFASTESSYITGTVLPVDGGRSVVTPGTRRST